ncbi:hexapeptide repeat-containing transferase [Acetobacter nitrogenifigens DSM 23921 = NBRC 105050]|uniref:Gamma carbonic anhydrase family protein n=1 Tax=Acetobacter nitrogenifigens DSM 23921 = NBRC 105050 TaxID=1120919 RepID=A0A511XBB7_9PROT|nr:gamma carbonic anhydrase family protein [Acetobacter nitrogenifigens]GBQ92937.1 hexapeptide repeat-containing transferase [Acetobacter nitrogenifigens DSM 23921 = NBRC 105050]GEN60171.1 gamma carbonic anhydrase family protein [Acetobacter nitrogenifigens DSM 23921 = NBRC 105050]
MLYELGGRIPDISPHAGFIAENATLIGSVTVRAQASVWFGAVLRGDTEAVVIGEGSNIQDNAVLHTDPGFPLEVAEHVTVGHLAMLHGCVIGADSLIGMGAIIMNGARIGASCLVAAGTVIPEGREFPEGAVIRGSPGKLIGNINDRHRQMMSRAADSYRKRTLAYRTLRAPPYPNRNP